jgi:ABC-type sugar transport system ATPase subunit
MSMAPLLSLHGISKSFGGLQALRGIDLDIHAGEILALVGDNGAGKSTFIRIISGAETADSGSIQFSGRPVSIRSPNDARAIGIETLHQHLGLVDCFGVPENIFLGREITGSLCGVRYLRHGVMRRRTKALLDEIGIHLPSLDRAVSTLSGGQRQSVAISRLLLSEVQLIIMDEPMAALGVDEGQKVLDLMVKLSRRGIAVLVISHNLEHVFSIAHRIAVLKNGSLVGVVPAAQSTRSEITSMIVNGRQHVHAGEASI